MRINNWIWIGVCPIVFFTMCVHAAANKTSIEALKSGNLEKRIDGFFSLVKLGPLESAERYKCEFKISDTVSAKKAVIELLRRENKFANDNCINDKCTKEIQTEGYSEYSADLMLFVDSCEDESAISLFPGRRTLKKYPQQTAEAVLSTLENIGKNDFNKNRDAYVVRYLGKSSVLFKDKNKSLYGRVKSKLINLVDDEGLSYTAVETLDTLDDADLIPVFEKISKYDDSKGTIWTYNGKKHVNPVSGIAKTALDKLQQKQRKSLQSSTTEYYKE